MLQLLATSGVCCAVSVDLKSQVVVLVVHLISAGLSKTVAAQKARNSNRWLLAGFLFGPLGLIAAVGMPDRHQIVYLRYLAEQQGYQPRHACGGQKGEADA